MGLASTLVGAGLSFFVFAVAEMLFSPRYYSYVSSFAPKGREGLYMGLALIPAGVTLERAYDSSIFIERSLADVRGSLIEAVLLVVIVIYLFLRSLRATIVPALAIPISLVGTFAVLYFLDFSVNTLTLMGLVLAIGLVVDDAIVVLENVTRWAEEGTPPREAAHRGVDQIAFAVIAATVSTVAVFLPLAFLSDKTGRLFREFGIKPRAFHHAVEAYKIRTRLAAEDVGAVVWADWWGRKLEMLDAIPANAALLDAAGVRVALHSDSPYEIQRLNQQAARAMAAGKRAGIAIDRARAIRWITANPAWMLGIDERTVYRDWAMARAWLRQQLDA